jgi:hypothetical protein
MAEMKLQPFSETKDDSIGALLHAIGSAAVSAKIEVVDHWDADRYAIGFHRVGAAEPLLYVTTWQLPSGSFRWYLETKPGVSTEEGVVSSSDALLRLLEERLLTTDERKSAQQRRRARSA